MKTPDKSRKAAERERMRKAGFKRFESWVHPDDFEKVSALVAKLRRKRTSLNTGEDRG